MRRRDTLAVLLIALVVSGGLALPQVDALRGLSIDVLTWLRWEILGARHDPATSPTVVIAVDEETYATKPFEDTPVVTWTREIGRVLTAVVDAGAKVVGFDIILPTSIEQSEVLWDQETLGARVRGFDRDFLRALNAAARNGKVVLGQVQHSEHPVQPSRGQRIAVGQQRNIRPLNAHNDPDDIIRRLPLTFAMEGESIPSMAVELATRARGASDAYRVPENVPNTITLNFEGGGDDIPTYSLADLRECIEKGDGAFFAEHFAGKVVLIGTVLDSEDRKIASKRFATGVEGARAARCVLPAPATNKYHRDSISGVYLHATAVNNLLRHEALREFSRSAAGAIGFAFAAAAGSAALILTPAVAVLAFAALALLWTGAATWAFAQALVLPLIDPILGGLIALAAVVGYRFVVADKDKRLLRKSFALYLAPAVIEKMMASSKPPALGGESRSISIYFSDVAGFSSFSEKMSASELVTLMNEYLSAMTEIIEEQGGFVDKYIGDAIVAVFGAPLDDPHHAQSAVRAALKCRAKLAEMNAAGLPAFKGFALGQRIGLNSGEALVGNIGSRRRFNYTVMGDAVNLASRLEGANKYFGTTIMASETTAELAGAGFVWRELDAIRVKGRGKPVKILEPLGEAGQVGGDQARYAAAYAQGLARWRARDFAGAAVAFAAVAERDPPAALFLARAQEHAAHPPGADWEPVNTLEGK